MKIYTLENDILKLEISSIGAELQKIYSKKNNKNYMWHGDESYWKRHSPILFPHIGKLLDDEAIINNKLIKSAQHGFLRNTEFEILSIKEDTISFIKKSDSNTLEKYPYNFNFIITYRLINNEIKCYWEIKNTDNKPIYFSVGAHPAFNIPINKDVSLNDYYLEFDFRDAPNIETFTLKGPYVNEIKKITLDKKLYLKPSLFKNDALIYNGIDAITIKNNVDYEIKVKFKNFPYVGIWSKYYDDNSIAPFICIEPWYGIADTVNSKKIFEKKLGINLLEKNKTFNADYSIYIYYA